MCFLFGVSAGVGSSLAQSPQSVPYAAVALNSGQSVYVIPATLLQAAGRATPPQWGGGYSKTTGLQIELDLNWPAKYGYQLVRVKVQSATAAAANRQVSVRFSAGNGRTKGRNISVEQDAELPLGASSVTLLLAVPRLLDWEQVNIKTWVDGRMDPELTVEQLAIPTQSSSEGLAILQSASLNRQPTGLRFWRSPSRSGRTARWLADDQTQMLVFQPGDLPTEWLHFSAVDLVMMTTSDLSRLAVEQPQRCQALLRWVRTGGNLWLQGETRGWNALSAVDAVLRPGEPPPPDASREAPSSAEAERPRDPRWRFVPIGDLALDPINAVLSLGDAPTVYQLDQQASTPAAGEGASPEGIAPADRGQVDEPAPGEVNPFGEDQPWRGALYPPQADARQQALSLTQLPTSEPWFVVQGLGLGTVTVFKRGELVEGAPALGAAISKSLVGPRLRWTERHGHWPDHGVPEFNNWLIPGVGVAPVGEFQFLVSLFVIVIGPLNYLVLSRKKKLPLLIVTAPVGAAAVTLLLFAYGLLWDGLGVRVRARSLTILDQEQGEVSHVARLSYFAGLAPTEGLQLPIDVAQYPMYYSRFEGRRRSTQHSSRYLERELKWGDTQRLTEGWIPTRSPVQFQQIRARRCDKQLVVETAGESLRLKNQLQTPILHVALEDYQGRMYWADAIAPGDQLVVPPGEPTEIKGKLRTLFSDNDLSYPVGAPVPSFGAGGYYGPTLANSLGEAYLTALNSPMTRGLGPGHYLAITAHGLEVSLGVEGVEEEASFHVLWGSWRDD
jgi:hypothetical protein